MTLKDSCVQCVNYEIRTEALGLEHEHPIMFVCSQVFCRMFIRLLACILPYVHSSDRRYFVRLLAGILFMSIRLLVCISPYVNRLLICILPMFIRLLVGILQYVHSSARMYFVLCLFVVSQIFFRMFI